jgi:hypothetical protein
MARLAVLGCAIERDVRDSFIAYKVLNGISAHV